MDGLTIRDSQKFLDTGKTATEIKQKPLNGADGLLGDVSGSVSGAGGKSFADTLKESVANVNNLQKVADTKAQELATGKTDNIQDVMVSTEKADIALRLMVNVRNKIIDAYQDIMKMQV